MLRTASPSAQELLRLAYSAFNTRDLGSVLPMLHPEVEWPNGMEGGIIHGRDSVRDYWLRQWGLLDPRVEPVRIDQGDDGRLIVAVHQIIRTLAGQVLAERFVEHVYQVEDGLIRRMEIARTEPAGTPDTSLRS
jgi:nuclear transport factor 2 (NTF2) superfamily protein